MALEERPAIDYMQLKDEQFENFRQVKVVGHFKPKIFFIDNQIHNGQFGYEVIQLMRLNNFKNILVSRGWVKGALDRAILPSILTPSYEIQVTGYLYQTNENIALDDIAPDSGWPKRVQSAKVEKLYALLGEDQVDQDEYLLRLDHLSDAAFESHWNVLRNGPEKHLGYAFQWFSMGFLLFFLFVWSSVNKKDNKS